MTKDIVGRLAEWIVDYATMSATLGDQVKEVENGLREDFPILETLSPPDGVGLTRYDKVGNEYDETTFMAVAPAGEWVRYEDAAAVIAALTIANDTVAGLAIKLADARAALAAEKARGDGLEKELTEALTKVENDRTLWSPEWQGWLLDARAALSVQPEEG